VQECRELYERAQGRCENCGDDLPPNWHDAHLLAWTNGGATTVDQMEAWCPPCNLRQGAQDTEEFRGVVPREWQTQALTVILERIWSTGAATLHAAPGAGKTFFAGMLFQRLHAAGLASRLVIVVPNTAVVRQWADALGALGIHLDWQPRAGFYEIDGTVGCVVTYQSLPGTARQHRMRLDRAPTLVVLDEVHHVGEQASWGRAVAQMVGDIATGRPHAAGVLNMTGTLFRSSGAKRISTVRYDPVADEDGAVKLQAVADYSVATSSLIGVELRAPDLYVYGGEAELVDLKSEQIISGDIADLDAGQRKAVMRNALDSREWVEGFAAESVRLLQNQLLAMNHEEPLKLLFIASNIRAAQRAADAINRVTRQNFSRLVTSDRADAIRTLRRAAGERHSCAIIAVRMVTEGFDCAHVSTIAYASNIIADLFIAQMMARAMRITRTERANGRMLPAQILIPDNPDLRRTFASALVGALHVLDVPEDAPTLGGRGGQGEGAPRLLRYQLLELSDPALRRASVLTQDDGDVDADELQLAIPEALNVGIPEVFVPRAVVFARHHRPKVEVYDTGDSQQQATTTVTVTPADPRSLNVARRSRVQLCAKFMAAHIDHEHRFESVVVFQALANQHAGVSKGHRDQASPHQLARMETWMVDRIREHCATHDEPLPTWARDEEQDA
jgi:superfamily II DNA or RNA helicase